MLNFRYARKTEAFLSFPPTTIDTGTTIKNIYGGSTFCFLYSTVAAGSTICPIRQPLFPISGEAQFQARDIVLSFKEWFKSRNKPLLPRIYEILSKEDEITANLHLSRLNLQLSEALVLKVLKHGKDVLSCLKFFDWAGHQRGFYHTPATFNAVFKILSKAKLMSLMLDFLDRHKKQGFMHKARFYDTLVMGYAVAGKPEVALQLFGRMRFQGIDLDEFTYHVLLNALMEEGCFDAFDMVAKQIKLQNFENEVTHSVMIKKFCKLGEFDKAEEYTRQLMENGVALNGEIVHVLIDSLCKNNQFEKAGKLVEEFSSMDHVSIERIYGAWIRNLVQDGKVEGALKFVQDKKLVDGYIPDVFCYNTLISRLLKENQLVKVFDLLTEMKEIGLHPDEVTMNAALCFLCKAGVVDVALGLYDSREFGLSPSRMAYNYLINTLLEHGNVDEAYRVLENSIELGHFPGKRTYSTLANTLCTQGKLNMLKNLIISSLERNFMPTDLVFDNFIAALCRARRLEDAYLLHRQLTKSNNVAHRNSFINMINGFSRSSRGDIAAKLLLEMQENGHKPTKELVRKVILSFCDMDHPDEQFRWLLGMQLSHHQPDRLICNYFIDGAGHAGMPKLAKEVYEMMMRSGIQPNMSSDILLLQSYLKSGKIALALNFFHKLSMARKVGKRVYRTIIIGLCKANKPDYAWSMLKETRENGMKPCLMCYEKLVKSFCEHKNYHLALNVVEVLVKDRHHVSSFIGNILLWHSLKTPQIFEEWFRSNLENMTPQSFALGKLVGVFSGSVRVDQNVEDTMKMIEQCFPRTIFTCNLVLRRLCLSDIEHAYEFFHSLSERGYEPNHWTYEILIYGLFRSSRKAEARRLLGEMVRQGFELSNWTKRYILRI